VEEIEVLKVVTLLARNAKLAMVESLISWSMDYEGRFVLVLLAGNWLQSP
jgi:hypothetical protein